MSNKSVMQSMVGDSLPKSDARTSVGLVVKENVQAIVQTLELLGFDSTGFSPKGTEESHMISILAMGQERWMEFYKYKVAAWKSYMLEQELPPRPDKLPETDRPGMLIGGSAGRWIKMVRDRNPRRMEEIIATISTVGRAMNRATDELLLTTLKKTYKDLTSKRELKRIVSEEDKLWADEIEVTTQEEFGNQLRRTVKELLGESKFTWRDAIQPFFPTTNATYLSSRAQGGAVGHIIQDQHLLEGLRGSEMLIREGVAEGNGVWGEIIDDTNLTERFRVLYERIVDGALQEEKKVELVALAEALKVRVISKGPVLTYTALKPLQKWLWRKISSNQAGRLTGEEITPEYLEETIGELREDEFYLSGDYKAATDNLDPWISETITEAIGEHIEDRRLRKLNTDALTGHTIQDPENETKSLPQLWGQLMGSIVSFPVLCIANLTICRMTREHDTGRSLTLKSARIAINGDDCLFRASPKGRLYWEKLAHWSGMAPSIGKYFFSREFANMNSAQFRVVPSYCNSVPTDGEKQGVVHFLERVPFINMGIVCGQKRSTGAKTDKCTASDWGSLQSISSNVKTLIAQCSPEDKHRVFKSYLNRNWEMLSKSRLPWFLPEHLGGLGLPTFPDYKVEENGKIKQKWMPTELDLRLAASVHKNGKLPSLKPENVPWKVWEYAQTRLKQLNLGAGIVIRVEGADTSGLKVQDESNLMSKLCIEALFVAKKLSFLYNKKKEKNTLLNKVRKEVDRCMQAKFLSKVEPFSPHALPLVEGKPAEKAALSVNALEHAERTFFTEET